MKLILASDSPREKSLLNKLGLVFVIEPFDADIELAKGEKAEAFARRVAKLKGESIAGSHDDALVLSHYAVIDLNGSVIGVASDKKEAVKILQKLSGKVHVVISAVVLIKDGKIVYEGVQKTSVAFKKLEKSEIESYVEKNSFEDVPGVYEIQGDGGMFVESIDGSYFNVVGLPIGIIIKQLEKYDLKIEDSVKQTIELQEKSIKESFPR